MFQSPEYNRSFEPSSSHGGKRTIWNKEVPCYYKRHPATGVVALSLTSYAILHSKLPLEEQILELHRLHLKLDAVVLENKAVKFSGSAESYLVAVCCDSPIQAARTAEKIAHQFEELDRNLKGVASFGEVGFALLGSTAWNYQFYGQLISDMKRQAEQMADGNIVISPKLKDILENGYHGEMPDVRSAGGLTLQKRQQFEAMPQNPDSRFHTWWASRVQYTDMIALVITFVLAALAIRKKLEQPDIVGNSPQILPLFLQVQCCITNAFIGLGWAMNRKWFVENHTSIMSLVWCVQFINRGVQIWTSNAVPATLKTIPALKQILGMNGPEKFLLMTAPVNLWLSALLHFSGYMGSLAIVFRSWMSSERPLDVNQLPPNMLSLVMISFVAFVVVPMQISIRIEKDAKKSFEHQQSTKSLKAKED